MKNMRLYFRKLCVLGLSIIYSIEAFEFVCPHISHRRLRALRVCQNTSVSDYACLFDIYLRMYTESCDKVADFVLPGEQYVISGARVSSPCPSYNNRYQPFQFWSNVQSKCYYQKSLCNEVGQLNYSQNSPKDDSTCHCDYTKGYGFAIEPKNPCYCIPSEEDCSCYKVQCPASTVLSAAKDYNLDYKCRSHQNEAYKNVCQSIVTRTENSSERKTSIDFSDHQEDIIKQSVWIWLTCLVIIGLSILSALYICIQLKTFCYRHISRYIEMLLDLFPDIGYQEDTHLGYQDYNGRNSTDMSGAIPAEEIALETAVILDQHNLILRNKELFWRRLQGHLQEIKKKLENIMLLNFLFRHSSIDKSTYDDLNLRPLDFLSLFILLYFLEKKSDNVAIDFLNMCTETNTNVMEILSKDIKVKRWPRRDFETCVMLIRSEKNSLKKKIELKKFLDVCVEHFICSLDDYKYVNHNQNEKLKHDLDELIIGKLESVVNKGSFECLLDYVKDQPDLFKNLDENLTPAIFIISNSQPMSILPPEGTELVTDKRIILQMQVASCEQHIQLIFIDRIKYCSKWFIQVFAMYPDHTTVRDYDNSLECVPLVDDVMCRLIKSKITGDFERVMEIYFCGKDVIRRLSSDVEIQISVLVGNSDSHNANLRVEPPHYDMATFLSEQREFLLEELQPSVLIKVIPEPYEILFKDIDSPNNKRGKTAGEILDILNKNSLSEMFRTIISTNDDFYKIHERFLNLQNAFCNSDVAASIIDNFVNLATDKFDLSVIKDTMTEKIVFDEIGTSVDGEENMKIEFLVKIVSAGQKAIGTFVDALYKNEVDNLADSLFKSRVNELPDYSGINAVHTENRKDVLLQARFKISFASNLSQDIYFDKETV